jgi:hypothetical protein
VTFRERKMALQAFGDLWRARGTSSDCLNPSFCPSLASMVPWRTRKIPTLGFARGACACHTELAAASFRQHEANEPASRTRRRGWRWHL